VVKSKKAAGLPRPPQHLAPATRKWWSSVVAEFELQPHHLRLLTLACQAWDRGEQARAELEKLRTLVYVDEHKSWRPLPQVAIERDARIAFARLLRELGLDLAAPDDSRIPRQTFGRSAR
jgi:phage terminase small subunit